MAVYIEPISGKKGTSYKVRSRVKGKNRCKTFATHEQAARFVNRLRNLPSSIEKTTASAPTLGEIFQTLLDDERTQSAIKGAASNLRMLLNYNIANVPSDKFSGSDLVHHCQQRNGDLSRPSPATLYHDITNIISALKLANTLHNLNIDINSLVEGKAALYKLRLISGSTARIRRPTSNELDQILELAACAQSKPRVKLPILDIVIFALETAMRRGEITRVTWADYKPEKTALTIRNRKDPNKPTDHTLWLSPEAIAVIERQPKGKPDEPIFPFSACTITARWNKLCKQLNISDLHFHDLRAEAACRYYLEGWNIVRIAGQTGHKDLNTLNNFYLRLGLTEHQLLRAA